MLHFPSNGTQDQRLVFSVQDGITWTKNQGNPGYLSHSESPHDKMGTGFISTTRLRIGSWCLPCWTEQAGSFGASSNVKFWTWKSNISAGHVQGISFGIIGWEVPDMFGVLGQSTKPPGRYYNRCKRTSRWA